MTTLRTFKRRRQKMAAFLRTLKRSHFDMRVVIEKAPRTSCGTKACLMGWMPRAFPTIGSYSPDRSDRSGPEWPHLRGVALNPAKAARFFALPEAEFFYPDSMIKTETPKQVAKQLLAAPYSSKFVGKKIT